MKKLRLLCMIPFLLLSCGNNKETEQNEVKNSDNTNIQVVNTYTDCSYVYDSSTNSVYILHSDRQGQREFFLSKDEIWIITQTKLFEVEKNKLYELSNKTFVLIIYI